VEVVCPAEQWSVKSHEHLLIVGLRAALQQKMRSLVVTKNR